MEIDALHFVHSMNFEFTADLCDIAGVDWLNLKWSQYKKIQSISKDFPISLLFVLKSGRFQNEV